MHPLQFTAQVHQTSKWDIWPFNAGYGGDWQTSLATYAFSALILGGICLFLRLLYGPKGIWRDKEMDREAEAIIARELRDLEAQYASGRISKSLYEAKKRSLRP